MSDVILADLYLREGIHWQARLFLRGASKRLWKPLKFKVILWSGLVIPVAGVVCMGY
jgi:hypothetical protein